ncbi:MAG: hypothetical protein NC452_08570 [Eubacterium sp.]|nr:hypothetical protein [Eubacterium sp.]
MEEKNYEENLQQEKINWGEFFDEISRDWHEFKAKMFEDIRYVVDDEEYHKMLAEVNEYPETARYASDLKKVRIIAKASEKAVNAIGKCLDGAAAVFAKKK